METETKLERGQRVYLRRPSPQDEDELHDLITGSRDFLRPWVYPPTERETLRKYLRGSNTDRVQAFFVCLAATDEIAGVVNVTEIVRGVFQSAYLGFYAGARHAGKGLMREGLQRVLRHAFRRLKLHRLEANIQPENAASIRLVRSLGFRKEGCSPRYLKIGGRWRDHERWALLAEDWRALQTPRA